MLQCRDGHALDQGPIEHYGVEARFSAHRKESRKEPRDDLNKTRNGIVDIVVDSAGLYLNTYKRHTAPQPDGRGQRVSAVVRPGLLWIGAGGNEVRL
jgi:hypothetical protein